MRDAQDSLINKEWVIGKRIGSGGFGDIHLAGNVKTNQIAAAKFEDRRITELLPAEAAILKALSDIGRQRTLRTRRVPQFLLGRHGGQSFIQLRADRRNAGTFTGRLVHSVWKLFLPQNDPDDRAPNPDAAGGHAPAQLHPQRPEARKLPHGRSWFNQGIHDHSCTVYLIDYNLSRKFRDTKTLSHIPYRESCSLVGTVRYASINAQLGIEQSRRDDLESLGYLLVYFLKGHLPWQGLQAATKAEKNQEILECKIITLPETLCEGLPEEFPVYLNYVRNLQFDEKPDYSFLRKLFKDLFVKQGYDYDLCFDWMNPMLVGDDAHTVLRSAEVS